MQHKLELERGTNVLGYALKARSVYALKNYLALTIRRLIINVEKPM